LLPLLSLFLFANAAAAQCIRTERWQLSDVAQTVLTHIETNPSALQHSTVPASQLLSTCNRLESVHVDGPNIFSAARDMIAKAQYEVDIAFFNWEASSNASRLIGDGLIAAQWNPRPSIQPLLIRIVIDDAVADMTRAINHIYDSKKDWASRGLDLSRVHVQLATAPRGTDVNANLHDKFITVDGRYLLVTGSQPETSSDPFTTSYKSGWHDSGYVFEGDAARSAMAAFDFTWSRAFHWDCEPRSFAPDCEQRSYEFPPPARWWMPAAGTQRSGDVPMIAVPRTKGSIFDCDIDNPQAIAWVLAMDRATTAIHVETPNVNGVHFRNAIVRAIGRGVKVRLITSLGFNDFAEDPVGGDNMEVLGRLRQEIVATYPWYAHNFELRWYSKDGQEPVFGNRSNASHTKYMTTDGRLGIVGSGNQDIFAWHVSQEFNVLIDDAAATAMLDNTVFNPDWSRAIGSYLELYEGNDATQDVVCPFSLQRNKSLDFGDPLTGTDYRCDNDEARSMLIHDAPAGKVIRFYDDPYGRYQDDDWTEVIVKRPISRKYIGTFERSFEDADVRVIFHRDNGLDGKISYADVSDWPTGAVVDLHEGNSATQNLVCSTRITGTRTINLTSDAYCNNDEARSLSLYDFPADKVIFLFDDPGGSKGDDWTLIVPKRRIAQAVVPTFERSFENEDMRVCRYAHNGLDGKVSRMRIGSFSEAAGLCGIPGGGGGGTTTPTPGIPAMQ
ncbi:MAG TPA: phospholipase D-like domain-containing protein, partial [Thermoanaerobaculia bacterium]